MVYIGDYSNPNIYYNSYSSNDQNYYYQGEASIPCDYDWCVNHSNLILNIDIDNVEGGNPNLTGVWKVQILDNGDNCLIQLYTSDPDNVSIYGLASGDYTISVYYQHDDEQAIWEYWGDEAVTIQNDNVSVIFTREMPWGSSFSPGSQTLNAGENLVVTATVTNDLNETVHVVVEGQIGNGNVYSSGEITIPAQQTQSVGLTIQYVSYVGNWDFRYWIKSAINQNDVMQITDHGYLSNYVNVIYSTASYESDHILIKYTDADNDLWELGVDFTGGGEGIYTPKSSYSNITFYKNGTKDNPNNEVLQKLFQVLSRRFEIFYPNYEVGPVFDGDLHIWRPECSYSWACRTALFDFESEVQGLI